MSTFPRPKLPAIANFEPAVHYAPSLLDVLQAMVKQRRELHRHALSQISQNLPGREPGFGKKKLNLTTDQLVEHMKALDLRRQTTRELMVLVPLRNCLLRCVQMKVQSATAFNAVLAPFRAKLSGYAAAGGSQAEFEKPIADVLISTFPSLLRPQESAHVEDNPEVHRRAVDEGRLRLYNKIVCSSLLDNREMEDLRAIFWR